MEYQILLIQPEHNTILHVSEYYGDDNTRELLHRFRDSEKVAINSMALSMSKLLPTTAEGTLLLCQAIQTLTGATLANIIFGNKRESLYDLKKENKVVPFNFFGLIINKN